MKKMSLQSVTIFSFTLIIAIIEKSSCQQSTSFLQATLFIKLTTRKSRQASFQPAFKLRDVLECPQEFRFHTYRNIKMKSEK